MSIQNRWLHLACTRFAWAILAAILPATTVRAQLGPQADPTPFAPGDPKRPIFDTRTAAHDTASLEEESASRMVAEVDGRVVTLGDVRDAIGRLPTRVRNLPLDQLYPGIVEQLVRQEALVIRAEQRGVDQDPAVRRRMKAASDQVLADGLLQRETTRAVTEAALLQRYNKETAGNPGPEEVHVRVIMVPTEREAMDIIGELRKGADFATLAKRSSKDPTASGGGDAGFVTVDQLSPDIGGAVFSMQPGTFTSFPVRSVGAWFVLKVEERRRQAARPFSAMREELRQAMMRESVPDVITAALAGVMVRKFDFNGNETDPSSVGSGLPGSDPGRP
jgi:peptidyl-prolyl cis-trans isomerase C